jgi:hypothetical protein
MAGSLNHIVSDDGHFEMDCIENLGDAHEALFECFEIIRVLSGGSKDKINAVCENLNFPCIKSNLYESEIT